MEEDVTSHAEFLSNGSFDLGALPGKYKVCGETAELAEQSGPENILEARPHFVRGSATDWGQPHAWQSSTIRYNYCYFCIELEYCGAFRTDNLTVWYGIVLTLCIVEIQLMTLSKYFFN